MKPEFVIDIKNLIEDKRLAECDTSEEILDVLDQIAFELENNDNVDPPPNLGICCDIIAKNIEFPEPEKNKILHLFDHKYFGYSFYNLYDNNTDTVVDNTAWDKILDNGYEKTLYVSLAKYYNYYGSFYDNEMAIKMLCIHYPQKTKFDKAQKKIIVSALYLHCTNAGTPEDLGYAFNGISYISKYIKNLPISIVEMLLAKYDIYKVINDKVYRNQIYTIIKYSKINDKNKYKFFFIDSIYIASIMSRIIIFEKNKDNTNIQSLNWEKNTCAEAKLPIFMKKDGSDKCFWSIKKQLILRQLNFHKRIIAAISFKLSEKIIIYYGNESIEVNYSFDDWLLNELETKDFYYKIENLIHKSLLLNLSSEGFTFSYVYLNNYRKLVDQLMSFDNKFDYNISSKSIILNNARDFELKKFYGRNIYSLSCIVGKNGTGKTSIIEFLKNYFFKLIYLYDKLEEKNKPSWELWNNLLKEIDFYEDFVFLVIFNFKDQSYYVTNIKDINSNTKYVHPYQGNLMSKNSDNSKIIYFSNKIDVNNSDIFNESRNFSETNHDMLKSLQNYRSVDYSEQYSFYKRQLSLRQYSNNDFMKYNLDICYQLVFLKRHNDKTLQNWFGDNFSKHNLFCSNTEYNEIFKDFILEDSCNKIYDRQDKKKFSELLSMPNLKINFFSSGQYAKFSFMSKLYWCINGYNNYHLLFENILDSQNVFDIKNTIQENDTAIIFIDEGELYYHPEWQRTYISTLLSMIEHNIENVQIQIVITSNSPFIISDIKNEDITYLAHDKLTQPDFLTFGQNIHTLLKSNFFMKYTIGEFAKRKIEFIIDQIRIQDNGQYKDNFEISKEINTEFNTTTTEDNIYLYLKEIINIIGEEVYRSKLLHMLDICFRIHKTELELLQDKKQKIEEQIKKLEEMKK